MPPSLMDTVADFILEPPLIHHQIVLGLFERNTDLIMHSCKKPSKQPKPANLVHNFAFRNDSKIFQHVRNITKLAPIPSMVFLNENCTTKDTEKATLFNTSTLKKLGIFN